MNMKTSCGILLVSGLLAFVQLHFTTSSGNSTSEFSIQPNSNTLCPVGPCYTFSQAMDNTSKYFTSNTRAVFPPGYHEVSTEGQQVIQNVNNISLVGDNNDSSKIKCMGQFGLAFISITNLTVLPSQWWLHSKTSTLKEAAAETGGCSGLAHFMWTTTGFTKNSADFMPTELTYI